MFCFGFGRKKKLEKYERLFAEQNETIKQKDIELAEMKEHIDSYKNHMDARLMKKEEIIRKIGERWDVLESNFLKREEELGSKLNEMNNTQKELLNKLKRENEFKTNAMERQKKNIEKQNEIIKVHENALDSTKTELENLKENMFVKENVIQSYLIETKSLKEHIEMLEKENSKLSMKISDDQLELEDKRSDIEHLQYELNKQRDQNRQLENELTILSINKNKLEAELKEETESLRSVIEAKKKELQSKTELVANIEQDLKEANNQNVSLNKELEEINKLVTQLSNNILVKESRIKELQLHSDNVNRDLITKIELIETLEFRNKILECELGDKTEEHTAEKRIMEESIAKLTEQLLESERKLKLIDEMNGKLETKLKVLEQAITDIELKYEKELQNSQNQFLNMVHSKNMIIENLETSEKRAHENLAQKNEILTHLENEKKQTELNLSKKEKQVDELTLKIEDSFNKNQVLQGTLEQLELSKSEELDNIETTIKEQVKLVNEAYQKEREIKEHWINEFLKDHEVTIRQQIRELKNSKKIIDDMQQTMDQFVNSTHKKIESCTVEINKHKTYGESLQKLIVEKEHQNREMNEELVKKDNLCNNLKKQMGDNLKLLQTEILKSEIDPTLIGLDGESNSDDNATAMKNILRQIHTRNVVMKEFREEIQAKHAALIRIQEKYQKLSEKIKRVVITVTNAKLAYQELEEENKSLRQSLKRKQTVCDTVDETKVRDIKTRTLLLKTFSDFDGQVAKPLEVQGMSHAGHAHQHCASTPPLNTICEELEAIREKSRKYILNLGQHAGLQKSIEHLKAEARRERKLRKRQEALFSTVLSTLKAASAASASCQPDHSDSGEGDASLAQ